MSLLNVIKAKPKRSMSIGILVIALLVGATTFAVSGFSYLKYLNNYNKGEAAMRATFPQQPKSVIGDNSYCVIDDSGKVTSKKSKYKNSYVYTARDAVVDPLSEDVAEEYVRIDDSYTGEAITGMDRRGGAISFYIRTPNYGLSDIDIALASNWLDQDNVLHEIPNLTDVIKLQINGLDVKTENFTLPASGEYQHLILKDTHLIKGENILTLTTSSYNDFGNKDSVLYIMPNIRSVTVMTNVKVYTPKYTFDTSGFKTTYALYENVTLDGVRALKVIGEKDGGCYVEEEIEASKLSTLIDYDAGKLTVRCTPTDVKELSFSIDSSEAANTITGQIEGVDTTIVINSKNLMTVTQGSRVVTALIELQGDGPLASIAVKDINSGDPDLFNELGSFLSLVRENDQVKFLAKLTGYYRTSIKANAENQSTDTFFYFGDTDGEVTLKWKFSYNGNGLNETLVATYVLANGKVVLKSKVSDSVYQWDHIVYEYAVSDLIPCSASDMPF